MKQRSIPIRIPQTKKFEKTICDNIFEKDVVDIVVEFNFKEIKKEFADKFVLFLTKIKLISPKCIYIDLFVNKKYTSISTNVKLNSQHISSYFKIGLNYITIKIYNESILYNKKETLLLYLKYFEKTFGIDYVMEQYIASSSDEEDEEIFYMD